MRPEYGRSVICQSLLCYQAAFACQGIPLLGFRLLCGHGFSRSRHSTNLVPSSALHCIRSILCPQYPQESLLPPSPIAVAVARRLPYCGVSSHPSFAHAPAFIPAAGGLAQEPLTPPRLERANSARRADSGRTDSLAVRNSRHRSQPHACAFAAADENSAWNLELLPLLMQTLCPQSKRSLQKPSMHSRARL